MTRSSGIDASDRILRPLIGVSIKDVMMHGDDRDAIHQTHVTQPVTVALQLALADLWTSWGVTASAVLGHSLGEVAAAIHAGVMDIESGLTLVAHRARLMQSTAHGSMLAVKAPLARVTGFLEGTDIAVAAINGNIWGTAAPYINAESRIVLITGHRRENFGSGFRNICAAIATLAEKHSDWQFIYPVHLNPNVQAPVFELLSRRMASSRRRI